MRVHFSGCPKRKHQRRTPLSSCYPHTLLVQWNHKRGGEVFRSWITDLPVDTPLPTLVAHATSRRHIETDYRDMKQALGLGHYEGRGYDGFHHHIARACAAHLFCLQARRNPKDPPTS